MNGSSRIRNYTRYVYQGGGRFHDLLRCALVLRNRRMSFGDRFCKWKLSSRRVEPRSCFVSCMDQETEFFICVKRFR